MNGRIRGRTAPTAILSVLLFVLTALSTLTQSDGPARALGPYTLNGASSWTSPVAYSQGPLTLSVRLTSSMSGWVTKIRFYKAELFSGSHTAYVWDSSGTIIGQEAFTGETTDGWQEVTLSAPVAIAADSVFSVGFTLENGFAINNNQFPSYSVGPFTIINGYYVYQASTFPNQTVGNNYMIDLTYSLEDPTLPTTTTTTSTTSTSTSTTLAPTTTTTSTSTTTSTTTLPPATTSTTSSTTAPTGTSAVMPTSTSSPSATSTSTTISSTTTTIPAGGANLEDVNKTLAELSASASAEKAKMLIAAVFSHPVTADVAMALSTNQTILEQIEPEQALALFAAIDAPQLTNEQKAALASAVTNAPTEVKIAFESSVDVYKAGIDTYVPNGSVITVGKRRALIAATAAVSAVSTGGGIPTPQAPRRDGPQNADQSADVSIARRKARELASTKSRKSRRRMRNPEDQTSPENRFLRTLKTLAREISSMAFPLAGSAIVIATLSGHTRKVAIIATVSALILHGIHVLTREDGA